MTEKAASGTVSVYFITATAAFVLLTALLIDFSRVAAFRYYAELAVQSGVRSVLSSFDPVLYARYGLFVRGGEVASELLRTTAEGNLSNKDDRGAFPYLEAEWTSVDVTESRPLADHEVFRRQVLEEMKYKAPIDLALEFSDRFRGVSRGLKEAAVTVDMLEKMRQAYDRREAAFDEVLDSQKHGGDRLVSLLRNEVPHASDIAAKYEDYVRKRQKKGADVSAYEADAAALAAELLNAAGRVISGSDEAYTSGSAALAKAKAANEEMRAISLQAASVPSADESDTTPQSGSTEEVEHNKVKSISELRKTTEQLVLDDNYFRAYTTELESQRASGRDVGDTALHFSTLAASIAGSTGLGSTLRGIAARLQSAWTAYTQSYSGDGSVIRSRRQLLEAQRSGSQQRKAEERQARTEWSGVAGLLAALSGRSGSTEDRETFNKAAGLAQANLEWNRANDDRTESTLPRDASEGRSLALSGANTLMEALQGSLSGLRDELYFSEYTIQRLSRFSPSEVKRLLKGEEVPLALEQQETEFILYGFNSPAGNIAAAYGEIISIRLAIRTMEGLIECRAMGHPLVVLAAALAYGVRHALLDIQQLIQQDSIPLSKYINVPTTYADYLRLFLLLHGGSAGHLARTVAVMEQASGVSFSKAFTYVSGEGTASLRLWFFPGLLKVMGRAGQLGGTVKGNRYEAAYTADSSYQ